MNQWLQFYDVVSWRVQADSGGSNRVATRIEKMLRDANWYAKNPLQGLTFRVFADKQGMKPRLYSAWRVNALALSLICLLLPGMSFARDLNAELMIAASEGREDSVRVLISEGADINAQNANGKTALMTAAYFGNERVVRLILASGADVNIKDNNESTALIAAAVGGNPMVVQALVAEGADVNAASKTGATAMKNASVMGFTQVAQVLEDAGAEGGGKKKKKKKKR